MFGEDTDHGKGHRPWDKVRTDHGTKYIRNNGADDKSSRWSVRTPTMEQLI
jgi:hypothetical protein